MTHMPPSVRPPSSGLQSEDNTLKNPSCPRPDAILTAYITEDPLRALPRLIEKIRQTHDHVVVWVMNDKPIPEVSDRLWTFTQLAFLAHGMRTQDLDPQVHPVWVTHIPEAPYSHAVGVLAEITTSTNTDQTESGWLESWWASNSWHAMNKIVFLGSLQTWSQAQHLWKNAQKTIGTVWQQTSQGWSATK